MFVCTICKQSLTQDTTTIYTTPCGHCSHFSCLFPWIKLKQSCPQCFSKVTENQLLKIFVKFDSTAPIIWDQKAEQDLKLLRSQFQLKKLYDEETRGETSGGSFVDKLLSNAKKQNELLKILNKHDRFLIIDMIKKITSLQLSNDLLNKQKKILIMKIKIKEIHNISLITSVYELHSINSVTIEKLKSELADLKARQCRTLQSSLNGSGNILSLSKGIFINNAITSRERQMMYHKQTIGQFSGQTLPPESFLHGCVFFIIEDRFWFDSMCNDKSTGNILKYGGSVEQLYSSKTTHVITSTRLNPFVGTAIRDKKRCVTSYWLMDVISRKQMLPPWLAHHVPTPYREDSLPYKNCIIGIVNFDINEYFRIKTMVEYTGGFPLRVRNVPSRVKLLISKNATNPSAILANRMNIPVVNVQWLNDIIFGCEIRSLNPNVEKYQNFNLPDPFIMNNSSTSAIMSAWNTPIMDYQVHHALLRKKQVSLGPLGSNDSDDSD